MHDLRILKNNGELTVIDVRSPSEYEDATIPGSVNIPLFSDKERSEVGLLYKQVSPEAAQEKGLEIVSSKLPHFIKQFQKLEGKKAVFCWRGGMRSKTSATVVDLMGMDVFRLDGGYRSYRNWVLDKLNTADYPQQAYVLNGNTGVGKTAILHQLHHEGFPVIDLEAHANHRGSIFGQIGMAPHNQKTFDSLLIEDLERLKQSDFVLLEGESRRIGKVLLPDFLLEKKEQGIQFFIDLPIEERVTNILDDYQPWDHEQECMDAFKKIKRRMHTPIAQQIETELTSNNYSLAVRLLLEYYYDPLYEHSINQYREDQIITIHAANIDEAVSSIRDYLRVKQHKTL